MKTYKIENNDYELIKDYKNGFDYDAIKEKYTEYFEDYDYILGDWSYGKLRLKGFCNKENPKFKDINDIEKAEEYKKDQDSPGMGCMIAMVIGIAVVLLFFLGPIPAVIWAGLGIIGLFYNNKEQNDEKKKA